MVAGEATPFIKTGGLADVLGALPAALRERGEDVAVVLPWYRDSVVEDSRLVLEQFPVWLGKTSYPVRVHVSVVRGVPYYLVECPPLFDRDGVYVTEEGDFADNHVRFAVLSRAALTVARWVFRPDILHCHDWQAGLVPVYLRNYLAGDPLFLGVKVLLTIHNLGYQGLFPASALGQMGLDTSVFHYRRARVFRQGECAEGRNRLQRRPEHRQPGLRARDPDARVRARHGWPAGLPQRRSHGHSQWRGLLRVEPRNGPSHRGELLQPAVWRANWRASATCSRSSDFLRRPSTGPWSGWYPAWRARRGST